MGRVYFHGNCQCYNIPNNFQPTAKSQIFLSWSGKQWQRRKEAPGSIWDRTSTLSTSASSTSSLCQCRSSEGGTHSSPGPPTLCQCHRELRILDKEELAREMTVTSLFGTMWDSLHGKAAVDLRATCSRPNNIVVGGMPSCLCGRRVSSPSTINSSCDLLKLCRFNPRHH